LGHVSSGRAASPSGGWPAGGNRTESGERPGAAPRERSREAPCQRLSRARSPVPVV